MEPNLITRSDLRTLLQAWQSGKTEAAQVHAWAETRYLNEAWEPEDDVANEILAELDALDLNLLTAEDVPVLLAMLEHPEGEGETAAERFLQHCGQLDFQTRRRQLAADPLYAPYCE